MGLWHDIRAMDALLARSRVDSGAAASDAPVSTGIVASREHVEHIDINPHFVPGSVGTTSRTVAAHRCVWCKVTPIGVLHMDGKDGVAR